MSIHIGWAESFGKAIGEIERGTALRNAKRVAPGPASWSPAPEARLSRERKTKQEFVASNRSGGLKGSRSLRANRAIDAVLGGDEP